ncbi:MAG: endonuclease III domain-containing protein [Planctomycetota bacterium]|jgi:endonuclease-3 related protein
MVSRRTTLLMKMYEAMLAHFGPQRWWPSRAGAESAEGKLEICVGAVLTQNTNWNNVERAIDNLREADCLSVAAIAALTPGKLAKLIRPAGYFNVKARRLKNFIRAVAEAGGDINAFLDRPIDELRPALLAINGVGPETADSMILYAAGKPTFVIDAYTFRIFRRAGLLVEGDTYDSAKELFESSLPADAALYNEYHALIVSTGKHFCRRRARCKGCPLESFPHDATAF